MIHLHIHRSFMVICISKPGKGWCRALGADTSNGNPNFVTSNSLWRTFVLTPEPISESRWSTVYERTARWFSFIAGLSSVARLDRDLVRSWTTTDSTQCPCKGLSVSTRLRVLRRWTEFGHAETKESAESGFWKEFGRAAVLLPVQLITPKSRCACVRAGICTSQRKKERENTPRS